ncbi:MAG: hypothetical protein ACREQW_12130 [Candidatus Binatia bacterium]
MTYDLRNVEEALPARVKKSIEDNRGRWCDCFPLAPRKRAWLQIWPQPMLRRAGHGKGVITEAEFLTKTIERRETNRNISMQT